MIQYNGYLNNMKKRKSIFNLCLFILIVLSGSICVLFPGNNKLLSAKVLPMTENVQTRVVVDTII